jgi:hypothetical protein
MQSHLVRLCAERDQLSSIDVLSSTRLAILKAGKMHRESGAIFIVKLFHSESEKDADHSHDSASHRKMLAVATAICAPLLQVLRSYTFEGNAAVGPSRSASYERRNCSGICR